MNLGAELRRAIRRSGLTLYRVAKNAGLPYAVVHRFMRGERDVYLETASRLAESLGLELKPKRKKG